MNSSAPALYKVIREKRVIGVFNAQELAAGVREGSLFVTDEYTLGAWPVPRSVGELFAPSEKAGRGTRGLRTVMLILVLLGAAVAAGVGLVSLQQRDGKMGGPGVLPAAKVAS